MDNSFGSDSVRRGGIHPAPHSPPPETEEKGATYVKRTDVPNKIPDESSRVPNYSLSKRDIELLANPIPKLPQPDEKLLHSRSDQKPLIQFKGDIPEELSLETAGSLTKEEILRAQKEKASEMAGRLASLKKRMGSSCDSPLPPLSKLPDQLTPESLMHTVKHMVSQLKDERLAVRQWIDQDKTNASRWADGIVRHRQVEAMLKEAEALSDYYASQPVAEVPSEFDTPLSTPLLSEPLIQSPPDIVPVSSPLPLETSIQRERLTELETERNKANERVAVLESQLSHLREELVRAESKSESVSQPLRVKVEQLERQLSQLRPQIGIKDQQIKSLQTSLSHSQQMERSLGRNLEAAQNRESITAQENISLRQQVDELRQASGQKAFELVDLRSQLSVEREKLRLNQQALRDKEKFVDTQAQQVLALSKQCESLKEELEREKRKGLEQSKQHQQTVSGIESRLAAKEKELETARKKHQESLDELSRQLRVSKEKERKARDALSHSSSRETTLKKEVASLKDKITQLEQQLENESDTHRLKVNELQQANQTLVESETSLKEELQKAREAFKNLQQLHEHCDEDIEELQSLLSTRESEYQEDLKSKNAEIESLKKQLSQEQDEASKVAEKLEKSVTALELVANSFDSLSSELESTKASLTSAESEHSKALEHIRAVEKERDKWKSQVSLLQSNVLELQLELRAKQSKARAYEKELKSQLRAREHQVKLLESELKGGRDVSEKRKTDLLSVRSDLDQAHSQLIDERKATSELRSSNEELEFSLRQSERKNKALESTATRLSDRVDELSTELSDQEIRLTERIKEEVSLRKEAEVKFRSQLEEKDHQILELEKKLKASEALLFEKSLEAEVKARQQQRAIDDLKQDNDELRKDVQAEKDRYKELVESKKEELGSVLQQLSNREKKILELQQLRALDSKISQSEIDKLSLEVSQLRSQASELKGQLIEVEDERDQLELSEVKVKSELAKANRELKLTKGLVTDLEESQEKDLEVIAEQRKTIRELETSKSQLEADLEDEQGDKAHQVKLLQLARTYTSELERDFDSLRGSFRQSRKALSELTFQYEDKAKELRAQHENYQELLAQKESLEETSRQQLASLETLNKTLTQKEDAVQAASTALLQTRSRLSDYEYHYNTLKREFENKEDELNRLSQDLSGKKLVSQQEFEEKQKLQKEVIVIQEKLRISEVSVKEAKAELEDLRPKADELEELQVKLTSVSSEKDKLEAKLKENEEIRVELQEKLAAQLVDIDGSHNDIKRLKEAHERQLTKEREFQSELENRISALHKTCDVLNSEKSQLAARLKEEEQKFIELKKLYEKLETSSNQNNEELVKVREQLQTSEKNLNELRGQHRELTTLNEELTKNEEKLKEEVTKWKQDAEAQAYQVGQLSLNLMSALKSWSKEKDALAETLQTSKQFEEELEQLQKDFTELEKSKHQVDNTLEEVTQKKDQLQKDVTRLESDLQKARELDTSHQNEASEKEGGLEKEVTRLQKDLDAKNGEIRKAVVLFKQVVSQHDEGVKKLKRKFTEKSKSLEERLDALVKSSDSLVKRNAAKIQELEEEKVRVSSLLDTTQKRVQELELVVVGKDSSLEQQRKLHEQALNHEQGLVRDLEDKKSRLETELKESKDKVSEQKSSLERLTSENARQKSDLEQLSSAFDSSQSEVDGLKEKVSHLELELTAKKRRQVRDRLTMGINHQNSMDSNFSDLTEDSDDSGIVAGGLTKSPGPKGVLQLQRGLNKYIQAIEQFAPGSVDLDEVTAVTKLQSRFREATTDLNNKVQLAVIQFERDQDVDLSKPPTRTALREALIKFYQECDEQVVNARKAFVAKDKEYEQSYRDLLADVDSALSKLRLNVAELSHEEQRFKDSSKTLDHYRQDLDAPLSLSIKRTQPEEFVFDELSLLRTTVKSHTGALHDEVKAYSAGAVALSAVSRLKADWAIRKAQLSHEGVSKDEQSKQLSRYLVCLDRLKPHNLPDDLADSIPSIGLKYLQKAAEVTAQEFEEDIRGKTQTLPDTGDVRGCSGRDIARSMLADPEACQQVLSLLSSLETTHTGLSKDVDFDGAGFDYYDASEVGLRKIRERLQLMAMPTMGELLEVCLEDLSSGGSRLLAASAARHGGSYETRTEGLSRSEKLKKQCESYQALENKVNDSVSAFRGQCHNGKALKAHPHQKTLDCFIQDGKQRLVMTSGVESPDTGFKCKTLSGSSSGLMNTFLSHCGKAVWKESDVSRDQFIQLDNGSCVPKLLFSNERGQWQISLGGRRYTVDPGFLLDHPNVKVPFEGEQGGQFQRDWIPLKDNLGRTYVMALSKVPGHEQAFLYEAGPDNQLLPKPMLGSNPGKEALAAEFFYRSALLKANSPKVSRETPLNERVKTHSASQRIWQPRVSKLQLQKCYQDCVESQQKSWSKGSLRCVNAEEEMTHHKVSLPVVLQIEKAKSSLDRANGARLSTLDETRIARFSVEANFDRLSKALLETKRKQLGKDGADLIKGLESEQKQFRREAFRKLAVYQGCELAPEQLIGKPGDIGPEGSTGAVLNELKKVVRQNSNHCMRLAQAQSSLENRVVKMIRDSDDKYQKYSDPELLELAVSHFEQGQVPEGVDVDSYNKVVSGLLLVEISHAQTRALEPRLAKLQSSLQALDNKAQWLKANPDEYQRLCQEWNLEMALVATQQQNIRQRMETYEGSTLNSEFRAIAGFERKQGTVLRPSQVDEVKKVLKEVDAAVEGKEVSLISHKGTGWGKSTALLALSDYAVSRMGDRGDRSVLVVAPPSNQAELDSMLTQYYAPKGIKYCRLNLMKDYVESGARWWSPAVVDQIHNQLLGLPAETPASQRETALRVRGRSPAGASNVDIQILMHLRKALQANPNRDDQDQQTLDCLDECLDMMSRSMLFCDEWDSAMMPHSREDLEVMATDVNRALGPYANSYALKAGDVVRCHAEFILGCKHKHLLSATTGTTYTAALASRSEQPSEISARCRTDVSTTNQRFWHWVTSSQPIFFDSNTGSDTESILSEVLDQTGFERQVMVLDARVDGKERSKKALEMSSYLNEQRAAHNRKVKGMGYYDPDKKLMLYRDGDETYGEDGGARMPEELEMLIRAEGGQSTDMYMDRENSVGTNPPQGLTSVGVLICQPRTRESLFAQQLGRLQRASPDLRKPQQMFIAVDMKAIEQMEGSDTKERFKSAHKKAQEKKILAQQMLSQSSSAELRKAIKTPLFVGTSKAQVGKKGAGTWEKTVQDELERLKQSEWASLDLSEPELKALADYKKAEWECRAAWFELLAQEVAGCESDEYTKECESLLKEARVNSYVNQTYADEKAWLQGSAQQVVATTPEPAGDKVQVKDPVVQKYMMATVVGAVQTGLAAMPRKVVPGSMTVDKLMDAVDPAQSRERIQSYFESLRKEGVQGERVDKLVEVRPKLYQESLKELRAARDKLAGLARLFDDPNLYGKEHIDKLIKGLDKRIEVIVEGRERSDKAAVKSFEAIDTAYHELMASLPKFAFYYNTGEPAIREKMQKINEQLQLMVEFEAGAKVGRKSFWFDGFSKEGTVITQGHNQRNVHQLVWRDVDYSTREPKNKNDAGQFYKLKGRAVPVEKLKKQGKDCWADQLKYDSAVKTCATPGDEMTRAYIDAMEKWVLDAFDQASRKAQEEAAREQAMIKRQEQLMQAQMFQVAVC